MATHLYSFRDSNIRKTWAIVALFFVVVIGVGWIFSYVYESPVILYVAAIVSVAMNVGAYWGSDTLVLSLTNAKGASSDQHKEIYHILENLTIATGLPMPKLYIINDSSPNAFATGRNPSHAVVALTTGLIDILDRSELEGVIAHELSHIKNYDMLVSTVMVVLAGFLALVSDFFLRTLWFRGGGDRDNKGNIMMLVGVVAAVLAPIAGMLIKLAVSRKREYLADASGALMTRYPEGLASALEKIAVAPPLKKAHNATAHLFFVNPLKEDTSRKLKGGAHFFAKMFMTHPSIEERIRKLRELS
jgi:heat shock protein HtpX